MDTNRARHIFKAYGAALAYVEVADRDGSLSIGSAFHVGEGVYVTARHVVEGKRIVGCGSTETTYIQLEGPDADTAREFLAAAATRTPVRRVRNGDLLPVEGPFFHPDPLVDVAVFRAPGADASTPVLPLGDHLDDWLGESDFVLSEAVVLGYPPIPLANRPHLVGARAEVNAVIDRYDSPHVSFVLSATPRAGFSGGVAVSEWGQVLGVITSSLLHDSGAVPLGYLTVLSVEPIYVALAEHKLLPKTQAEAWDGFWNVTSTYFWHPDSTQGHLPGVLLAANVDVFDDGTSAWLEVSCDDDASRVESVVQDIEQVVPGPLRRESIRDGMVRLHLSATDRSTAAERTWAAGRRAAQVLMRMGYRPLREPDVDDQLLGDDPEARRKSPHS